MRKLFIFKFAAMPVFLVAGFTVMLIYAAAQPALAANVDAYWTGGSTGNWEVAGNWNPSNYWPDNLNGVNTYNVFIDNNAQTNAFVTVSAPGSIVINNLRIDAGDRLLVNKSADGSGFQVVNTTTLSGTIIVPEAARFISQNLLGGSASSFGTLENATAGGNGMILVNGTAQWLDNSTRLVGQGVIRDISNSGILGSVGAKMSGTIVNNGLIDIDISKASTYDNLVITGSGSILSDRSNQVWAPETASSTLRFQGAQTFTGGQNTGMRIQGTSVNEGTLRVANNTWVTFENLLGGSASSFGTLENATAGGNGMIIVNGTAQWLDNSTRLIVSGTVSDVHNSGLLDSNNAHFEGTITNTGTIAISSVGASSYGTAVIGGIGGRISGNNAVWNPLDQTSTLTFEGIQTFDTRMHIGGTAIVSGTLQVAPGIDVMFKNLNGGNGQLFGILASEFPQGSLSRFVVDGGNLSNIIIANGGYLGSVGATFDGRIINAGVVNHDIINVSKYGHAIIEGSGGVISGVTSKTVMWLPTNAGSSLRFKGDQTIVDSIQVAGNVIVEGKLANQKLLENLGSFKVESSGVVSGPGTYRQLSGQTVVDGTMSQDLIEIKGGTLSGNGTINGDVTIGSGAEVNPGNSPGTMTIDGNYTQNILGILNIELAGLLQGTEYDFLNITGTANLFGELDIDLLLGFDPLAGSSFNILHADNGIFGTFSILDLPQFTDGRYWDIVYGQYDVALNVLGGQRPVPEPATVLLLGSGLIGLIGLRRRMKG